MCDVVKYQPRHFFIVKQYFVTQTNGESIFYQSLASLQRDREKESKCFVYDKCLPSKAWNMNPYESLLYILNLQSWKLQTGIDYRRANVVFHDVHYERDCHAILIKSLNPWNEEKTKQIIELIVEEITKNEVKMIINVMQNRLKDLREKTQKQKEIMSLNLSSTPFKQIATETIELWFDDIIFGPLCITRCLSQEIKEMPSQNVMDRFTTKINNEFISPFWNFTVNSIVMFDHNFYLFSEKQAKEMDYPMEVDSLFIEISTKYEFQGQIVKEYEMKHLEEYENNENLKWSLKIVQEKGRIFLRTAYDPLVFDGFNEALIEVLEGDDFTDWLKDLEIEPWIGRKDTEKLMDHRMLKMSCVELQHEISKLKQKLNKN